MTVIDNQSVLWGEDLKKTLKPGAKLKLAASYFSIFAYEALKEELEQIEELQFIFTSPTFTVSEQSDRIKKERREYFIPKLNRERTLYGHEFEVLLRNKLTQRAIARECAEWICRKVRFKSNTTERPLGSYGVIESDKTNTLYNPIEGLTAVNLGYEESGGPPSLMQRSQDAATTTSFLNLFDQQWQDEETLVDVTDEIVRHISSVYEENSPESIYFLVLYNIFHEFLEDLDDHTLPNEKLGHEDSLIWQKLYNFQHDAAVNIVSKLERYNGCILADSVGLGKTFTALAVIKYYELRNRLVLVLCPKRLSDNWLGFKGNLKTNILARDGLRYDVLSHTDLDRESGHSMSGMRIEDVNWGAYDLVVIDESHNFRNDYMRTEEGEPQTRYQKLMNRVIKDGINTKVLMLSATPVNNHFTDLRNQLQLAYANDSEDLRKRIGLSKSIEEIFRNAQRQFNEWSRLPAEERTAKAILDALDYDFFELLDSVTIARSRKQVERYYDTTEIGSFPTRRPPLSFRLPFTEKSTVIALDEIYERLSEISLQIYNPLAFVHGSKKSYYQELYDWGDEQGQGLEQVRRNENFIRLMTVSLLKRLESSVYAFRKTLEGLIEKYQTALQLAQSFQAAPNRQKAFDIAASLSNYDDEQGEIPDEHNQFITGSKLQVELAHMDIVRWNDMLKVDLGKLQSLHSEIGLITAPEDAKLQHLIKQVQSKVRHPFNAGNKKVLIFTAFADTAHYLYENLAQDLLETEHVHSALITGGSGKPKTTLKSASARIAYDFQNILTLFSPKSKSKDLVLPDEREEIDIVIATDCISEGQNLQDCDYVINYDIHWNPVRIIQRFGRIDRIGSTNAEIQLANYWPDLDLDEYINLKSRVENRMVISDVTAASGENVLKEQVEDAAYRSEQLKRLQREIVDLEDFQTGVSITDLGLNDFRADLLAYQKENDDIAHMPHGLHAVLAENPAKGLEPGVIFILRNLHKGLPEATHNHLHPFYLLYIRDDGSLVMNYTDGKQVLDVMRHACRGQNKPLVHVVKDFNETTNDGRNMTHYSYLLDQCIHEMIGTKEEKDIASLFQPGRTSVLEHPITGLDDFELIAFLVVQADETTSRAFEEPS